jgi:hypothetical protein
MSQNTRPQVEQKKNNNTKTEFNLDITVVPEFTDLMILPLFMIATLLVIVLSAKRKHSSVTNVGDSRSRSRRVLSGTPQRAFQHCSYMNPEFHEIF